MRWRSPSIRRSSIDPDGTRDRETTHGGANYRALIKRALRGALPGRDRAAAATSARSAGLMSTGAGFDACATMVLADPGLIGTTRTIWVKASDDVDMLAKGYIDRATCPRASAA